MNLSVVLFILLLGVSTVGFFIACVVYTHCFLRRPDGGNTSMKHKNKKELKLWKIQQLLRK